MHCGEHKSRRPKSKQKAIAKAESIQAQPEPEPQPEPETEMETVLEAGDVAEARAGVGPGCSA